MNKSGSPLNQKLQDATTYLEAGQKKEARQVLREALSLDRKNLKTWELLWQAAYNEEEELRCVKRILAIKPNHKEAKQRLALLQSTTGTDTFSSDNSSFYTEPKSRPQIRKTSKRTSFRRRKQQSNFLLLFLGMLVSVICVSVTGFALYRGGYIPLGAPSALTATALAWNEWVNLY